MNSFEIIKGQGGVPKALPNKDHVSGIIAYYPTDVVNKYAEVKVFETNDSAQESFADIAGLEILQYHIREYFRMQPAGRLWVKVVDATKKNYKEDIKNLQEVAEGEIRQIGIWAGDESVEKLLPGDVTNMQTACTELETIGTPLSVIVGGRIDATELTSSPLRSKGKCNVSVVVGEDMSEGSEAVTLGADDTVVSAIGAVLGCVSFANVNESIAWVSKFNLGYSEVGVAGKKLTLADKTLYDDAGVIFLTKYEGVAGAFVSDSHTMDEATSDYNSIESVRTIDKACRGVRTYLLPYLASPVYLNDDGTMRADSLANLKNVASQALEAMERAGELSGYVVEIDAKQNILANSTVEFVIKNVAVGVMRNIKIKIGYVTNL